MSAKETAYIGLGSNLGDRDSYIELALKAICEIKGTEVSRVSDIIETEALGDSKQSTYINAVAEVRTSLDAEELFSEMSKIEVTLGRVRGEKWSARTIDLDLLLFGEKIISSKSMQVPHCQMHLRTFVLEGMCQLNGDMTHPVLKESMQELKARLRGGNFMINRQEPQLVSIAGNIGAGKTTLAKRLSEVLGCKVIYEHYSENPFMAEVYAGRSEVALDSELFFLTSKAEQLEKEKLGAGEIIVSDYLFDKTTIYARQWLNAIQLELYWKIYGNFAEKVTKPVLVIYLENSTTTCFERIHIRNRPYEQSIRMEFLEALRAGYAKMLSGWKICPVIRLNGAEFDSNDDSRIKHLAEEIKCYTGG